MANVPTTAPFGSWKSPIQPDTVAAAASSFSSIFTSDTSVYWTETRPNEGGRYVIVKHDLATGKEADVLPRGFSARGLLYSYGGGAYTVSKTGTIVFSNYSTLEDTTNDQRLYVLNEGFRPQPITDPMYVYYGDHKIDYHRNRIVTILEDHTVGGEPPLTIVGVDLDGKKEPVTLVSGNDYYAAPTLSNDGRYLAWVSWEKPNMPWDNTSLYIARFDKDGNTYKKTLLCNDKESIFQPQFSPDNKYLYYVSDRSNWWSIYRYNLIEKRHELVVSVIHSEFGEPLWGVGDYTYDFVGNDFLAVSYTTKGEWYLGSVDLCTLEFTPIEISLDGHNPITSISSLRAIGNKFAFIGGDVHNQPAIILSDIKGNFKVLKGSPVPADFKDYLPTYHPVTFDNKGNDTSYAFFYAPKNPHYAGPKDELPPLLIITHGGPTAMTSTTVNYTIAYFTSRGFAVVDINYRGSTGYGREYRQSLYGQWGIFDRDDCVNCALYLSKQKLIDIDRVVARGVSAGGYLTVVQATYTTILKAGASYSGISNLLLLYAGTHKFEKYYIVELVGSYPEGSTDGDNDPSHKSYINTYKLRSPSYVPNLSNTAMIFFQGEQDPVVPPNQTEVIVDSLKKNGVPVSAILFPDEQHGLRIAANIIRALEAEYYFYSQLLKFTPYDSLPSIQIFNWPPK